MTPKTAPFVAALIAALASLVFVLTIRLPLPFAGFTYLAGAALAGLGTLALIAWMPARWLWSEAFSLQHGLSDQGAVNAISAVVTAHDRATAMRRDAAEFSGQIRARVEGVADRLDAAAREIFYQPDRLRASQRVLVRAELIEDAVSAHRKLRGSAAEDAAIAETSRAELTRALDALDSAFDEADITTAEGHLAAVETASEVAEMLLAPRRAT